MDLEKIRDFFWVHEKPAWRALLCFSSFRPSVRVLFPSSSSFSLSSYFCKKKTKTKSMGLDLLLFRKEKGGDPDIARESEKKRYRDPKLVDEIIDIDNVWKKMKGEGEGGREGGREGKGKRMGLFFFFFRKFI